MIHSKIILTVYWYFKLRLVTASNSALALTAGYTVFQAPLWQLYSFKQGFSFNRIHDISSPPCGRSAEYRLATVTPQHIQPPLLWNREQIFNIFLGKKWRNWTQAHMGRGRGPGNTTKFSKIIIIIFLIFQYPNLFFHLNLWSVFVHRFWALFPPV